jgi:hypothetical protein
MVDHCSWDRYRRLADRFAADLNPSCPLAANEREARDGQDTPEPNYRSPTS